MLLAQNGSLNRTFMELKYDWWDYATDISNGLNRTFMELK